MPNGRSGSFHIADERFRQMLQALPGQATVGARFGSGRSEPLTASEVLERLKENGGDDLFVEEQDQTWYIVQLGTDHRAWIVIAEASPLYKAIRRYLAELAEPQAQRRRPWWRFW
jgi:hypothetical protein